MQEDMYIIILYWYYSTYITIASTYVLITQTYSMFCTIYMCFITSYLNNGILALTPHHLETYSLFLIFKDSDTTTE